MKAERSRPIPRKNTENLTLLTVLSMKFVFSRVAAYSSLESSFDNKREGRPKACIIHAVAMSRLFDVPQQL